MNRRELRELGLTACRAGVSSPEELELLIAKAYILEARMQLLEMMLRDPEPDLECVRQVVDFGLKSAQMNVRYR